MGLKKLELNVYFKNEKTLMAELYHVQHMVRNGKMRGVQENFTFDVLYAEEIPFEIKHIDGKRCMVFQSKMNKSVNDG